MRRLALAGVVASALAAAPAHGAEWLAGDLHVHTCYSHDALCPDREPFEPELFYAVSDDVDGRFQSASVRGLDWLAITDHDDVRSSADTGFGAHGVIGIPGYENSLDGHAQVLGSRALLDAGTESAAEVNAMADALRASGGAFQLNHPGYRASRRFSGCSDTGVLHWGYGYDVRPDAIEILNPTSPAKMAERFWECWLERGARVGASGGSDSHWVWTDPVQGPGNPTTWALASDRSEAGVLAALRDGRTTVSRRPPAYGGGRLLVEADADGDGTYEAGIGDTVPAGSALRVRLEGTARGGFLTVRANGSSTLADVPLAPGVPVELPPAEKGWVRASLYDAPGAAALEDCDPSLHGDVSLCPYDQVLAAFTSPVYVEG